MGTKTLPCIETIQAVWGRRVSYLHERGLNAYQIRDHLLKNPPYRIKGVACTRDLGGTEFIPLPSVGIIEWMVHNLSAYERRWQRDHPPRKEPTHHPRWRFLPHDQTKIRNHSIYWIWKLAGVPQSKLADAYFLSRGRIGQIIWREERRLKYRKSRPWRPKVRMIDPGGPRGVWLEWTPQMQAAEFQI